MSHPTDERLEAFAENALDAAERATIQAHLVACPRCDAAVDEWRYLFGALAGLPLYAPAPGFAERVLARVRIRLPWYSRLAVAIGRLLPSTTRGWAIAAFLMALPIALGALAGYWLFSRPYVRAAEVWIFVTHGVRSAAADFAAAVAGTIAQSELVIVIAGWLQSLLLVAGLRGIGVAIAAFAALSLLSAWVLYHNLFRTPQR